MSSTDLLMGIKLSDVIFFENHTKGFFAVKKQTKCEESQIGNVSNDSDFHCKIYATEDEHCPVKRIKFYLSKISEKAYQNPKTTFLQKLGLKIFCSI